MGPRVYFCAENISVSAGAISVGRRSYLVSEVSTVRCERARIRWLWPLPVYCFALVLTLADGREIRPVRRRNAYFIFQLVNAVQAAVQGPRHAHQQVAAPLAENSSA